MHDPRTRTALSHLADLGHTPEPPRWHWGIARLDPIGRIVLPGQAHAALGLTVEQPCLVQGVCYRVALVLRTCGGGAAVTVDGRGRLRLPAWLRRSGAASRSLPVGARCDAPLVVVAPTTVLDGLGDVLAGESR
ncbi:MAG TPA: hypothetical protein VFI47_23745 [Acidimicrobiales bacterium]|nr:hypothetical protein [Acidimicrobiales bacterium]